MVYYQEIPGIYKGVDMLPGRGDDLLGQLFGFLHGWFWKTVGSPR